jgi:hypothetical protein
MKDLTESEVQESRWNQVLHFKRFRYKASPVSPTSLFWRFICNVWVKREVIDRYFFLCPISILSFE